MIDTSGFYKLEDGRLLYGPTSVLNAQFSLNRKSKDTYTYPVFGWTWFDSEDEARSALGLLDGFSEAVFEALRNDPEKAMELVGMPLSDKAVFTERLATTTAMVKTGAGQRQR